MNKPTQSPNFAPTARRIVDPRASIDSPVGEAPPNEDPHGTEAKPPLPKEEFPAVPPKRSTAGQPLQGFEGTAPQGT